ncbi:acyl-CoA N-acyltransferase, partial [Rhizopus microsporus var. microsporus]
MNKTLELYNIREATEADLPQICEIFNERISNSTCIFVYNTVSLENRLTWFNDLKSKGYPIIVAAEKESDKAVAYACFGSFRPHPAYVLSTEVSLYIHQQHQRKGLGGLMLKEMLRIAKDMQFHSIIASITADNEGSIVLFSKFGFRHCGVTHQVGYKFGKFLDVVFMEYLTDAPIISQDIPSFKAFPWGAYTFNESLF